MSVQKENISDKLDTLTDLIEELDDFLYEHRIPHLDIKAKHGGHIVYENDDLKIEIDNEKT